MNINKRKRYLKIIEQHKGIIFKVTRSYCKSEFDREDLAQEILAQIWRSLDTYNNDFKMSTWLFNMS